MNVVQALIDSIPAMLTCVVLIFFWAMFSATRLAMVSVFVASTATFIALLYLIWFMRDGMGPDAVTSFGIEAARRIGFLALLPLACWTVINGLSYARYRSRRKVAA